MRQTVTLGVANQLFLHFNSIIRHFHEIFPMYVFIPFWLNLISTSVFWAGSGFLLILDSSSVLTDWSVSPFKVDSHLCVMHTFIKNIHKKPLMTIKYQLFSYSILSNITCSSMKLLQMQCQIVQFNNPKMSTMKAKTFHWFPSKTVHEMTMGCSESNVCHN